MIHLKNYFLVFQTHPVFLCRLLLIARGIVTCFTYAASVNNGFSKLIKNHTAVHIYVMQYLINLILRHSEATRLDRISSKKK